MSTPEQKADSAADSFRELWHPIRRAVEVVPIFGTRRPRLYPLLFNIAHDNELYGNMVTYLRLNGIVPPSSQPRSR